MHAAGSACICFTFGPICGSSRHSRSSVQRRLSSVLQRSVRRLKTRAKATIKFTVLQDRLAPVLDAIRSSMRGDNYLVRRVTVVDTVDLLSLSVVQSQTKKINHGLRYREPARRRQPRRLVGSRRHKRANVQAVPIAVAAATPSYRVRFVLASLRRAVLAIRSSNRCSLHDWVCMMPGVEPTCRTRPYQ
jgi:hypothetical protein